MSEKILLWLVLCLMPVFLAYLVGPAQSATITKAGQLNPCDGPCTDYGIVMTVRFDQIVMKIYKVVRRKGNPNAMPSDVTQIRTSPGNLPLDIAEISTSPEKFDAIYAILIKAAKKAIPKNYHFGTPVFFLSSFSVEDIYSFAFTNVLVRVQSYLNNVNKHPFLPPSKDSLKKITGQSEIMYRWLTSAFLADFFTPEKEKPAENLGIVNFNLNMISQVTFPVYYITKNATNWVTVGGDTYLLVSSSHTQNGLSRALRRYFQALIKGKKPVKIHDSTSNPDIGMPTKTDFEETVRKIIPHPQNGVWPPSVSNAPNTGGRNTGNPPNTWNVPNTGNPSNMQNGQYPNPSIKKVSKSTNTIPCPCSPPGTQLEVKDSGRQYALSGSGDVEKCRKLIQNVIVDDFHDRPRLSPYTISPRRSVKFYAFKEVVSVLETIGCTSCSHSFTAEKIDAAARKYCKGEVKQSKPADTANCLNANFYYVMMTKVYRFNPKKEITILKSSKHNIDEDWSLGAFLDRMKLLYYNVA